MRARRYPPADDQLFAPSRGLFTAAFGSEFDGCVKCRLVNLGHSELLRLWHLPQVVDQS